MLTKDNVPQVSKATTPCDVLYRILGENQFIQVLSMKIEKWYFDEDSPDRRLLLRNLKETRDCISNRVFKSPLGHILIAQRTTGSDKGDWLVGVISTDCRVDIRRITVRLEHGCTFQDFSDLLNDATRKSYLRHLLKIKENLQFEGNIVEWDISELAAD